MQSGNQRKAPSDESALIQHRFCSPERLTPAWPAAFESPPLQSPSCLRQESRRAPAHASTPAHCPASYAREASPLPPQSTVSEASPVPSAPGSARPAYSGPPSCPATQAPPPEIPPADDKDPTETFAPLQHS